MVFNLHKCRSFIQSKDKDKLTTFSVDFLREDIPQGDLYIMSHVIHSLNDDAIDTLLRKVFKKLPKGMCTITSIISDIIYQK